MDHCLPCASATPSSILPEHMPTCCTLSLVRRQRLLNTIGNNAVWLSAEQESGTLPQLDLAPIDIDPCCVTSLTWPHSCRQAASTSSSSATTLASACSSATCRQTKSNCS